MPDNPAAEIDAKIASLDDWRAVLYETQYRTLSRKTGITYGRYHFRGEKLSYLIDRYGEVEVKVLIDVDDFRVVYVVEQDSRDLVILTNASTSESTPAYSYVEADAIFKEAAFGNEAPASEALRRDILNRSAGTVTPVTQPGKRTKASKVPLGTSRDTSQRARRHQAVVRAQENPLPAVRPTLGHPPLGTAEDDWSNAPALDVRDRKTGETRL